MQQKLLYEIIFGAGLWIISSELCKKYENKNIYLIELEDNKCKIN